MAGVMKVKRAPEIIKVEDPGSRPKQQVPKPDPGKAGRRERKRTRREAGGEGGGQGGGQLETKKCRLEVRKFVMQHTEKEERQEVTASLLVSLGAKPPKKKHLNIKQWREQKQAEEQKRAEDPSTNFLESSQKKKKHRRRPKTNEDFFDGQAGKYSGGVQYVSRKEFRK